MATGSTLNAANLEALGAARLAELLLEISAGDALAKRRLRLALAAAAGPGEAAREVSKRLASIAKAKSFIGWGQVRPLAAELEAQQRAIVDLIAPSDPSGAFELVWKLVGCAASVFARSDDGSGQLAEVFREAARDLGPLAQAAKLDPTVLAERVFEAVQGDTFGEWEELVPVLAPQLGGPGLDRLKHLMQEWQAEPVLTLPEHQRLVVGWSSAGKIHADEIETGHRRRTASFVLQQIAEAMGDVDAYVARFDSSSRRFPVVAADISRRLLHAGRPQEAWDAIEAVDKNSRRRIPMEWEQARIDVLEALGRTEDAQAFRHQCFLQTLNVKHLRGYLHKLPDFEDFDAEQSALNHALGFGDVHQALGFLVSWPDLERASRLVLTRAPDLNGDLYELLSPAADALHEKYPLAATFARRAMIDFTLGNARSSRYKHAARHLTECAALARRIEDFGGAPDHVAYAQDLRASHGRKAAFWHEVASFAR